MSVPESSNVSESSRRSTTPPRQLSESRQLSEDESRLLRGVTPPAALVVAANEPTARSGYGGGSTTRGVTAQLNWTMTKLGVGPYQLLVLVLAGGVYASEGSLLLILGIIAKGLIMHYDMSPVMAAGLATMILLGMIVGTIAGGFITDRIGRRQPILITYAGISTMLIIAIMVPAIPLLMLAKFLLGFFLGFGMPVASAMVCESCPPAHRSNIYALTQVCFSFGQCYSATIVWIISPTIDHTVLDWRLMMMCAAALPVTLFFFSYLLLHESAHWLVANDRVHEAGDVIRGVAWYKMNSRPPPPGAERLSDGRRTSVLAGADEIDEYVVEELVKALELAHEARKNGTLDSSQTGSDSETDKDTVVSSEHSPLLEDKDKLDARKKDRAAKDTTLKGGWGDDLKRLKILFNDDYRSTTIIMCYVCFVCNFCYYGLIYGLPDTLKRAFEEEQMDPDNPEPGQSPAAGVLMAAMFEIPGVFVAILLGMTVGRRANLFIVYFMAACCTCLLIWGILQKDMANLGMIGVLGVKLFTAAAFIVTYLYLLECYKTKFRATGLAFCMVVGRVGAFFCPFLYDGFIAFGYGHHCFFYIMVALAFSAAFITYFLPYETKDAQLIDS